MHGLWPFNSFSKYTQFLRKIAPKNQCGPGTFNKEMAWRINGKPRFFSFGRNLCGWCIFQCNEQYCAWVLQFALCIYIFFGGGFNYRSMKRMSSVWISRKWVIKEKLRGLWWLKCSGPSKSEQIKEEISSRIKHKIIIEEFLSMLCVPLRTHHLIWLQVTRRGSSNVSKEIFPFRPRFNFLILFISGFKL